MMAATDLVSAIITTHNRKDLVTCAIESVYAQTYPNIELFVVDDASDDGTQELLAPLSTQRGFTYIHISKEESHGGNHARNMGVLASHGAYIAFLDDDDEWLPEKTEKQVAYLQEHPDCLLVHCGQITLTNGKKLTKGDISNLAEGDLRTGVFERVPFATSKLMVCRSLIDQVGLFDESLKTWQEYEFAIRACQVSELGAVKERLVLYRVVHGAKRVTGTLFGWEDDIRDITKKHQEIFDQLTDKQKIQYELMIARAGVMRATNCGNLPVRKTYLKRIFKLDPSPKTFLKYALNKTSLKPWKW